MVGIPVLSGKERKCLKESVEKLWFLLRSMVLRFVCLEQSPCFDKHFISSPLTLQSENPNDTNFLLLHIIKSSLSVNLIDSSGHCVKFD